METIKKIYKTGNGPSSSHTMGPKKAAEQYAQRHPETTRFRVTLHGSLAATGVGHLTDQAIIKALKPADTEIIWKPKDFKEFHPNALTFETLNADNHAEDAWVVYSTGGGEITDRTDKIVSITENIYPLSKFNHILEWCEKEGKALWEYVADHEEEDIWEYLSEIWQTMIQSVKNGLKNEGVLPGPIKLSRKASSYYVRASSFKGSLKRRSLVFAYALAASEENAAGGRIVTSPTCGSCGTLPAVLYHLYSTHNFTEQRILRALATAALVGNIVKTNASISGAEVGCQGEIGTAAAMAAAAAVQLFGGTPAQIEYGAEMALEHHLGLTCDPVAGLVQIPCIERNAFAAARALDANMYALLSDGKHRVSFDKTVDAMNQTGHDLPALYKETSTGGLAYFFKK